MSKTDWTKDQKKAIEKRNSNVLVSASAGSGKTAVLVERITEKILNDYLDVDKILVVTFTNAAAQELKEKILNAIYNALEVETDPKRINHLRNQLTYINRACITTIDAFCYKLVKENFNILDIDPNIKICEESQAILIKSKVLEDLLEKEYEKYEDRSAFGLYNILELFNGKDEDFLNGILKIYNYIQSFPYPFDWLKEQIEKYNLDISLDLYDTDFGKDIYNDVISQIKLCISKYDYYLQKIIGYEDFKKAYDILCEDEIKLKQVISISNPSWDKLYDNLNTLNFSSFRIGKVSNEELKDELSSFRKDEVKNVIDKIKKKIYAKSNEILKDNKVAYEYITYLYDFLLSFDNSLKAQKKEQSIAEFNDIMHYALELLVNKDGTYTQIAISLKNRFKEIYTDEYQDTSYVQESILNAISTENNRFMVGDIKQSIYGFRQARPDIFNEKYISYMEDDENNDTSSCKIILSKNFRSRKEVIDSINYIFEKVMSMKNGQCEYSEAEKLKCGNLSYTNEENLNYSTQINIIDLKEKEVQAFKKDEDETQENYEIRQDLEKFDIEAKCIAYKIQEIMQNDKVMQKDGTLRKVKYKDIVILLRSIKGKAEKLEEELKKNNIPVYSDVSTSIFDGDETKLVLSFLKVIDNPYQDIFMVSTMFSIIGNFSLDEITKIRVYDSNNYIYDTLQKICEDNEYKEKEKKLVDKIEKYIALIKKYINYSKVYTISELLVKLYKDTNIYYQFALEENANSIKANLDYLIELASNFYSPTGSTLNSYIKYIDSLKDKQDTSTASAKIIGENEDVIRIMSIHKSKGLEFPIVILADSAKKYNFTDLRKEKVVFHHKYGIGIDIVNQNVGITYPSLIKHAIRSVIEKETKSEELRLLYVALTRAKEKLYIFATVKDYNKDYDMQSLNMNNNNKFNETLISSNNSYYENLLPVIKYYNNYEKDKNIFDIRVIKVKSDTTDEKLRKILSGNDKEIVHESINEKISKIMDKKLINSEEQKILKDNFEYQYKYIDDVRTPSRISVSNLKEAELEKYENSDILIQSIKDENDQENEIKKYKAPNCISDVKKYTAVRKGILIHFVLQNLDYKAVSSKEEINNYIEKLIYLNVINKEDKKYISITKIYNFLNSSIGKELKKSKEIYKEYEFILSDEKISNSLIQGVIDLFFVTESGKVVLVDFKTDRLSQEIDFIKKYKIQLDIYKEAINKLTGKNVDETYIYSFNLNKEIEV